MGERLGSFTTWSIWRTSDCQILWCGGEIPFPGISTCKDVATDSRVHGLFGMLHSQSQGQNVFSSVVAEGVLVSCDSWSCNTSPFFGRVPVLLQMVAAGGGWASGAPLQVSLHLIFVHWSFLDWLGNASKRFDCIEVKDLRVTNSYQHGRDEGSLAGLKHLVTQNHGRDFGFDEQQYHSGTQYLWKCASWHKRLLTS